MKIDKHIQLLSVQEMLRFYLQCFVDRRNFTNRRLNGGLRAQESYL